MPGIGDVRRWAAADLCSTAQQLQGEEQQLLDMSDELDASAQPREWVGAAADAAYEARGQLTERMRRVVTQVQAAAVATREAGDAVVAVQASLRETDELAATYYFAIGDDGGVRDALPAEGLLSDEAFLADRQRMRGELESRTGSILRSAGEVDADFTRVLTSAADDTLDDGTGTSLGTASFAGLVAGRDQSPIPPPEDGTPAANNAYWDTLTAPQQAMILSQHPDWVGNTDGIPAAVRDQANRTQLGPSLTRAQADYAAADAVVQRYRDSPGGRRSQADVAELDRATQARQAASERVGSLQAVQQALDRGGRQLLTLDTSGEMVKAAVAVGDVDTASNVSVNVPGMTTSVEDSLLSKDQEAAEIVKQAQDQLQRTGRGAESVASVSWIGYEAPQWGEFTDDADLTDTVATDNTARDTAPRLASFLNGIDASRTTDAHLTTLAHSYGTTTTGYALQQGTGVDDAIFFGSPGLGTNDVTDLGVPDGHVFVEEAKWDPVADLAAFGGDPNQLDGVTGLSTDAGTTPDGVDRDGSEGHSEYNKENSMSQYNQAVVVAGLPDRAVQGSGFGLGDVLNWWPWGS